SQFIELYNPGSAPVDVHRFEFENAAGQLGDMRAPSDPSGTAGTPVTIAAGGYAYGVPNPLVGTPPASAAFVIGAPGAGFALQTAGDVLVLHSSNGASLQDYVTLNSVVTDKNAV